MYPKQPVFFSLLNWKEKLRQKLLNHTTLKNNIHPILLPWIGWVFQVWTSESSKTMVWTVDWNSKSSSLNCWIHFSRIHPSRLPVRLASSSWSWALNLSKPTTIPFRPVVEIRPKWQSHKAQMIWTMVVTNRSHCNFWPNIEKTLVGVMEKHLKKFSWSIIITNGCSRDPRPRFFWERGKPSGCQVTLPGLITWWHNWWFIKGMQG